MTTVAVCLATFNRKDVTLRCLRRLQSMTLPPGVALQTYLADDASADGTADAVRREFPEVRLLPGSGSLFWGGGMRLAFGTAITDAHDHYIWLNDDVELSEDALVRLLHTHGAVSGGGKKPVIVVGATCAPGTQMTTYSGLTQSAISPVKFHRISPHGVDPLECATMNGNIVLIPAAVSSMVGNIDPHFTQSIGDFDYGLRARALGVRIWICPGFIGTCSANLREVKWTSARYRLSERLKMMNTPLGLPFAEFMRFAIRHGGVRGAFFALWGYRRLVLPIREKRVTA